MARKNDDIYRCWLERCKTGHMLVAFSLGAVTVATWLASPSMAEGYHTFVLFGGSLIGWLLVPVERIARLLAAAHNLVSRSAKSAQ